MNSKKLPKIMYDQTQFTPLYLIDRDSVYLTEESYFGMKEISGYTPDYWITYTQNKPESFWFGAYSQESLDEEGRVGFLNFTDKVFLDKFESSLNDIHEKSKSTSIQYLSKFYNKELESIENNPDEVMAFLRDLQKLTVFIESNYFLTQPQRFSRFDEEIAPFLPNPDLELVAANGRYPTYVSKLRKHILDSVKNVGDSFKGYDEYVVSNPKWKEKTAQIIADYGYLNKTLFGGELADEAYIKKEVDTLLENKEKFEDEFSKMNELVSNIEKRNLLVQSNDERSYQLADIMGHSSVIRFDLNTIAMCHLGYVDGFVKALMKKHDLTAEEISCYCFPELLNLILTGTKIDDGQVSTRQKGFLRIYTQSGTLTLLAEDAHNEIKDLLESRVSEIETTKEVKGTIASWPDKTQEKIKARAFVLTTAFDIDEELKKFQDGDILIATQTHPHLVPYMKSAVAIVTDEGGITCHAAIVSRELKKPCVIGTKLSTKIFKTGDIVEIDLSDGTVKKIN